MMSYKSIFKTGGLIGMVQVFQMAFGLIRNKVVAILLGAGGFGVWGLYMTYVEMVSSFSSLGLDSSGVRQIARHTGDKEATARCIWIFRRMLVLFSSLTAILSMIFSKSVSLSLFKTDEYYKGVIIVSAVILLNGIARGQLAILNGLRELKKLAISQVIGAVVGSVATVFLVLAFGAAGIPWAFVTVGLALSLSTGWYVKRLRIPVIKPAKKEMKTEFRSLIAIGLGVSCAGMVSTLMTYLARIYLNDTFDIDAVGIYQACWTISNLYVGIILTALGVDFLPRLSRTIDDKAETSRLINEQIELGLLVTSIGVAGILLFSPLLLHLLYAEEFTVGTSIIRWQVLGVALRVLAQPFSFAIMAKGKPLLYILIQSAFFVGEYLLLRFFAGRYGFDGLGVNYCVAYLGYVVVNVIAGCVLFGFRPTKLLVRIFLFGWLFIGTAWIMAMLPGVFKWISAFLLLSGMAYWILRYLKKYMAIDIIGILKNRRWHDL